MIKTNTCKMCGKEITNFSIRCHSCSSKKQTNWENIKLVLRFHDNGANMTETGKALHISRQRVDQIYKKKRDRYWATEKKAKIITEAQMSLIKLKKHANEVKFKCKYCKKPVTRKEAGLRRKFCSTLCGTLYRNISRKDNKKWIVCAGCGIKFHPWQSAIYSGREQRFHNRACYYKNMGLRRVKTK